MAVRINQNVLTLIRYVQGQPKRKRFLSTISSRSIVGWSPDQLKIMMNTSEGKKSSNQREKNSHDRQIIPE